MQNDFWCQSIKKIDDVDGRQSIPEIVMYVSQKLTYFINQK